MADTLRPFLIGTAGHVDHGKTTLIQALTGTNTDRLEEEQRRGMSIDLGFAEFVLPSGRMAGIVDVPGHERFLKNMLAGATGVDFALLVVAADEGVMPQTREHLAIMDLLNVPFGMTAITKTDLVDPDWLDMVMADIRRVLDGTFLAEAPLLAVDAVSGRGLDDLVRVLDETAARLPAPAVDRPAFLPIDRVFHRPGFGVVVTGSLRTGVLKTGDAVAIYPSGQSARIRGLQTFGHSEAEALAGMRTAVNLAGISAEDVERGDVMAPPGSLSPSDRMNVRLNLMPDTRTLKHRSRVRVHLGTAEILARVLLWEGTEARRGSTTLAQLHLEAPAAARRGDRFVVRWYSPQYLLGGGQILEPNADPFRTREQATIQRLTTLESGDPSDILSHLLDTASGPVAITDLAAQSGLDSSLVRRYLEDPSASGAVCLPGDLAISNHSLNDIARRWTSALTSFHKKAPLRPGMPREELRTQISHPLSPTVFDAVLGRLEADCQIAVHRDIVRLPSFQMALRPEQQRTADEILERYASAGWQPPLQALVVQEMGPHRATRELWEYLAYSGALIPLEEGLFLHRSVAEKGLAVLRNLFMQSDRVSAASFRDATQSSRKAAIPFLEWCDTQRYTRRLDDARVPGARLRNQDADTTDGES